MRRWCRQRVPEHLRDQVRVNCDIARLRYTKAAKCWSLYWRDRNLRFHQYDQLPASPHIVDLLQEVDRDPTAIFWG